MPSKLGTSVFIALKVNCFRFFHRRYCLNKKTEKLDSQCIAEVGQKNEQDCYSKTGIIPPNFLYPNF